MTAGPKLNPWGRGMEPFRSIACAAVCGGGQRGKKENVNYTPCLPSSHPPTPPFKIHRTTHRPPPLGTRGAGARAPPSPLLLLPPLAAAAPAPPPWRPARWPPACRSRSGGLFHFNRGKARTCKPNAIFLRPHTFPTTINQSIKRTSATTLLRMWLLSQQPLPRRRPDQGDMGAQEVGRVGRHPRRVHLVVVAPACFSSK